MTALKKLCTVVILTLAATFAFGQENCGSSIYGSDTVLAQKNEAMFNQYFKAKDYVQVYPYWVYLFENAPCASKRITFNGAFIAKKYLISLKKNNPEEYEARMSGIIDTILMTYDMRVKHWGDEYIVMAKKAVDMFKLRPDLRDSAMGLYALSVEKLGNKTEYKTPLYYMQAAITQHKIEKYSADSLFNLYFQLQDIISHNLKKGGKMKSKWVACDTNVTKMMRPYLNCEKITEYFKPQTDAEPENVELLKKVSNLLNVAKCNRDDYALEIAMKVYELKPSSEAALSIARAYKDNGNGAEAIKWYNKGVADVADDSIKADIYQTMAALEYKAGNVSSAKSYANKVLELNPNSGAAHLIIASSYAKSVSACTADGINGLSAYWAAVDRAVKAKTVDPSVEEQANKFIATYRAYFIKSEQAFFKNFPVAEGGTYTVPCLGVSTIVRFNK